MSILSVQSLGPGTVMRVREAIYAQGWLATESVDLLLRFAREFQGEVCPEWALLFSDVLTDYMVRQNEPQNFIPQHKADWLTTKLAGDRSINSQIELDMLLEVMVKAEAIPMSLSVFVLDAVRDAIMSGCREAVTGEEAPAGVVTSADTDALRAVFYAAAIGTADHVRREQAEVLFEIAKAATKTDPSFDELFARAVGNYLMSIRARGVDVTAVLRFDAWLDDEKSPESLMLDVAGSGAWKGDREEIYGLLLQPFRDAMRGGGSGGGDGDAEWLMAHIKRQGELSSAEKRLLQLLGMEIPPVVAQREAAIAKAPIVVPLQSGSIVPQLPDSVAERHSDAAVPRQAEAAAPGPAESVAPRHTEVAARHSDAAASQHPEPAVPRLSESAVPRLSEADLPLHKEAAVPRHSKHGVPDAVEPAGLDDAQAPEPPLGEGRSWSLISIDWGSGA